MRANELSLLAHMRSLLWLQMKIMHIFLCLLTALGP
jgi:hypothetical protein